MSRWLCYEQSIAAGLAKRAYEYHAVCSWDLRDHVLIFADSPNRITVQYLLPSQDSASGKFAVSAVLRSLINHKIVLSKVHVTIDGHIVICIKTAENLEYIAKVTLKGKLVWIREQMWNAVAVGTQHIFVLLGLPRGSGRYRFDKLCLRTGQLTPRPDLLLLLRTDDLGLTLSADETHIAIKYRWQLVKIVSSSTWSKRLHVGLLHPDSDDVCWLTAEPKSSDFLETRLTHDWGITVYRYRFEEATESYQQHTVHAFGSFEHGYEGRGIDIRRKIYSRVCVTVRGTLQFMVGQLKPSPASDDPLPDSVKSFKLLRVPTRGTPPRKVFEVHNSILHKDAVVDRVDYCGMFDGYFVFHQASVGRLIVVDFDNFC